MYTKLVSDFYHSEIPCASRKATQQPSHSIGPYTQVLLAQDVAFSRENQQYLSLQNLYVVSMCSWGRIS